MCINRKSKKSADGAAPASIDSTVEYLREIGDVPLLTADEEKALGKQVQNGDARAVQMLWESNQRLVVSIAKRYLWTGWPLLDLIQFGNMGVRHAIAKFDPESGFKFSTYATWWIKQAIRRLSAGESTVIRVPVHMHEKFSKRRKAVRGLRSKYGREPTRTELEAGLEMKPKQFQDLLDAEAITKSISFEQSLPSDAGVEGASMEHYLQDPAAIDPVESIAQGSLRDALEKLLDSPRLSNKQRTVIRLRFGLDLEEPLTLEQIGKRFGVSRERIRQIEARALEILGRMVRLPGAKELQEYLR